MEQLITDKNTGLQYELCGNVYLLAGIDAHEKLIGKWGQRHLNHLKANKKITYYNLLTSGRLHAYLENIDQQAKDMYALLISQYTEKNGITEQLKAANQMEWVHQMNSIRSQVCEVINQELIYT